MTREILLQARALSFYTAYSWTLCGMMTLCLCYGMMVEGQCELLQCLKLATAQLASGFPHWLDMYSPCRPVYSRASGRAAWMPSSIDASIAGTRSCFQLCPLVESCNLYRTITPGELCSAHSMNACV